jgi:hypothetical protein
LRFVHNDGIASAQERDSVFCPLKPEISPFGRNDKTKSFTFSRVHQHF